MYIVETASLYKSPETNSTGQIVLKMITTLGYGKNERTLFVDGYVEENMISNIKKYLDKGTRLSFSGVMFSCSSKKDSDDKYVYNVNVSIGNVNFAKGPKSGSGRDGVDNTASSNVNADALASAYGESNSPDFF